MSARPLPALEDLWRSPPRCHATASDGRCVRRAPRSSPIQQLTGQVSSHESQYQWGHPLLQLGIVAAPPINSPMMQNHSTCMAGRLGAKRAHTHAHRIDTTTKKSGARQQGGI